MREKQPRTKLTAGDARAIVLAYHVDHVSQAVLAKRYGVDPSHISRIVHGDARPEAYEAVKRELESGSA